MRAAIANKPNEAFVTAGAPQKKLDVPLSSPADRVKPLVPPAEKPDEADPDAPEGGGGRAEDLVEQGLEAEPSGRIEQPMSSGVLTGRSG